MLTQEQIGAFRTMATDGADLGHVARVMQCPPVEPRKAPTEPLPRESGGCSERAPAVSGLPAGLKSLLTPMLRDAVYSHDYY